jgi:hypothetical protein
MIGIKNRWERVANKEKWAARRTAFMAKAKATKAVWFPPKPAETGGKAASTAKKTTKKATRRPAAAAKRTTGGTKKVTKAVAAKKA